MDAFRKFWRFLAGPALTLVMIGGLALAPNVGRAASPDKKAEESAAARYHILVGEVAASRGQAETAAREFLQALAVIDDKALAERATTLALSANNKELSLKAVHRWLELDATSLEAREILIRLALRSDLPDEALQQGVAIVRDHPGGMDDGYRHVALLLSLEPTHGPEALALMRKLVERNPKSAGGRQALSLLALRFNDLDGAEKAAREALQLNPDAKEAPLYLMGALVKKGNTDAASEIIENQIKRGGKAVDLRLGYGRVLIEAGKRELGKAELNKVLALDADNSDAQYLLGLIALDESRTDDAQQLFSRLIDTRDHGLDAHYYLGRIAQGRGRYAEALSHYEHVSSGNQALDAALRRAAVMARLGQLDDAIASLDQLRRQFPQLASRFYLAQGEIFIDANALDRALSVYSAGLADDAADPDLLYARSLVYERQNKIDAAEADLRAILADAPTDARALNALGFMLIIHTKRLDEAEKLVGKAIELTPNEPAVIDSMGWLRFKQGRLADAVKLLQQAYDRFPDPEVAAHYGEALWTSGNRDLAHSVWVKALQTSPDNPALKDTLQRLSPGSKP